MKKQTKTKTGVLARWIISLCLSLVFVISAVYMVMFLVNINAINNRDLRSTADLTMRYINLEIQNAIEPALDLTNTTAAMVVNIDDFNDLWRIFPGMLKTVPEAFELYYGTVISRFDGGSFATATGWDPYESLPEWDQVKRPWFIAAMQNSGKTIITEPYVDSSTDKICVTMARTAISDGQIAGVVGVDVSLDVLTELVTNHLITKDGRTFIINNEGVYIVHENHDFVMNRNYFEDDGSPIQWDSSSDVLVTIEDNIYHAFMKVSGMDWIIVSTGSTDELNADFWRILRNIIIMGLIISFLAVIVSLRFSKIITSPIIRLFDVLKAFAVGDFTRQIEAKGKDEISQMTLLLKDTQESLKKLIIKIKNEAVTLSDIGNDLATNMNETAAAVNEIATTVDNINDKIIDQSASVSETNATMDNVVSNINKLNNHIDNQSQNISQASSAIEEMVANIQSVTTTLVKNAGNVNTLTDASEAGRNGLSEVATDIQEIARESEGLLQINSVMQNISSQTNLLSMNAAIEAAHAGEAGKGFAVVASEIRKLAENSSEQSKTIGNVLKKIKESIDKITLSTQNVLNKFEDIESNVRIVSEQEENIRNAMEEQGIGSKQILDGVGNVNVITRNVQSGSNEMLTGAKEVINESKNLEKLTQEISVGMNEMAAGAKNVNTAMNHVNEITTKNRQAIAVLINEVARFKVE